MILIDAPPVLPFADALATAPACDGVILVVRHGKTRMAHVRQAAEAMSAVGIPILGSVLSMTPARQHQEYGYGYRHYRRTSDAPPAQQRQDDSEDAPLSRHAAPS